MSLCLLVSADRTMQRSDLVSDNQGLNCSLHLNAERRWWGHLTAQNGTLGVLWKLRVVRGAGIVWVVIRGNQ